MEEYYFLFGLAIVWIVFAVVQDLRTREIANWLNFSLIAFALAYRAIYAAYTSNVLFFVYGLFGVVTFVFLAYLFYYSRIFAGGDAKLLMGLGGVLPFESAQDFLVIGIGFIFLLFLFGALWTLAYSLYLVNKNKKLFAISFKKGFKDHKKLFYYDAALVLVFLIGIISYQLYSILWSVILVAALPFLFVYVKAVEISCMVVLKNPKELTIGDWLEKDVVIKGKTIKKTVHGLSNEDIKKITKARKKVFIKEGVPFTPAFLIAFIVGIYAWLRYFPLQF